MSGDDPMSEDLADMEDRLTRCATAVPPTLRGKVLATVARELAAPADRPRLAWPQLAAVAAVAIVALNLARISAMVTDFVGTAPVRNHRTMALAAEIRAVVPELSPREAQRMAMVMTAGEGLTPMPLVHGRSMPDTSIAILQER